MIKFLTACNLTRTFANQLPKSYRMASNNCDKCGAKLNSKGKAYQNPALTVDIAVLRKNKDSSELLMIKRGNQPFKDHLAFPGGFVDYGEEPKDAALRELKEETNLVGKNPKLVGVYGNPNRDPRQHTVSAFYFVDVENPQELKAGDDAAHAEFIKIEDLDKLQDKFAFDHKLLYKDLLDFVKSKL